MRKLKQMERLLKVHGGGDSGTHYCAMASAALARANNRGLHSVKPMIPSVVGCKGPELGLKVG